MNGTVEIMYSKSLFHSREKEELERNWYDKIVSLGGS